MTSESGEDTRDRFLMAGWRVIGETAGGLVALGQSVDEMPPPLPLLGTQMSLEAV